MVDSSVVSSLKNMFMSTDFDEDTAMDVIDKLYSNASLEQPELYIFIDCPESFDYAYCFVKSMLNEIDGQTSWKVANDRSWESLKERIKMHPPVRITNQKFWVKVCDNTYLQIKNQIKNLDVIPRDIKQPVNGEVYRKNYNPAFIYEKFPDYIEVLKNEISSAKILSMPISINAFNFLDLVEANMVNMVCFENICFASKPPIFIRLNDNQQFDCKADYALYWRSGRGKYFVEGVKFDDYLFLKGFKYKKITPEEIMEVVNVEQKSLLIKEYGYDFIKQHLKNLKTLSTYKVVSKITGKETNYEVFEYDFQRGVRVRVVKVECHTTHHLTFLGVPRVRETESCLGAISWTFGMNEDEYVLASES